MLEEDNNPNAVCSGDDTCLRHFEYKSTVGRCHKCLLLSNSADAEHARIAALPQCLGCGVTSSRLDSDSCGLCMKKNTRRLENKETVPAPGPTQSQAQNPPIPSLWNRGQFHRAQWKDAANINLSGIKAQQSTVAITGANMATLRSNNLATSESLVFIMEPYINSKSCTFLSTFEVIREATAKFSDMVATGIASFNSTWEEASEASLVRSDLRFSRMNNVHIEIGPHSIFRDVLQTILNDSGQNLDKTVPTKFRARKFPTIYLEVHINLEKFYTRTGVSPPRVLIQTKKRVWNDDPSISSSLGVSVLKRTKLAGTRTLRTSFALESPMSNATQVVLFFANHTKDPVTGVQSFTWLTDNPAPHEVLIANEPIAKGKSKLVFKATYDGVSYVAKRCYSIGQDVLLSIAINRDELVKEGRTLGRGEFFLNKFKEECEAEEIDISDFEVTDFIVAREGVLRSTTEAESEKPLVPSPASGIKDYETLSKEEKDELSADTCLISSVTWLLELERGNIEFRKYSGTLEHPRYTDKQGATINAFQHFTYLESKKTLVLADIQSSESHNPSTKTSVLFDLMSHTVPGNSGAGDHGEEGIQTFVKQHQCGQRCGQLGFEPLNEQEDE
ncbi:kinase-like domain-containing protein [Mycena sanguinolenta]|nr:kinase-like domain-containing protein [Mycena sanguinolenta]KAJ6487797.1 kinase-like domain-containing protein [Mycena sanguinolenta]